MRVDGAADGPSRSLSDYWRLDRSTDRSRELASILGGAATQAELVQYRLRRSGSDARAPVPAPVVLDPRLLSGFGAPVPGEVVDCIVGLAVRAAALRTLSVDSSGWSGWIQLDADRRREFTFVHRSLEEVYVSQRLSRLSKALAGYLRAMRRMVGVRSPEPIDFRDAGVSRDVLLGQWLRTRLLGERVSGQTSPDLSAALRSLDARCVVYLRTRNARRRLELAGEIWAWLAAFPPGRSPSVRWWPWGADDEGGVAGPSASRQMRENLQGGGQGGDLMDLGRYPGDASPAPSNGEGKEGSVGGAAIELITDELRELGVRAAVTALKDARFDLDDYERVCAEMAPDIASMRHVFSRLDDARARWRYGLRRGRIDGRGLTRAAAGKDNVFKSRDHRRGSSMALVFLVDVSASMRSYMAVVNRASCVVSEALRELAPRVWYEVVTYTSGGLHPGAPVQMTRLAASGMRLSLRDVWSDGGTPTGEAIAAALVTLRRRQATRKLVLHFTDGHPKDTYVVRQALELCRRFGVDVLTVSVGASQDALYGEGKCEVAYSVPELISVLGRLLPRIYRRM